MTNRRPPSVDDRRPTSAPAIPLKSAVENWLADGRANGWSKRTLHDHKKNLERFAWWLVNEAEVSPTLDQLTAFNVRTFMGYLREEHPTGRFDCQRDPGARRPARPSTVATYHRDLKALVKFLIAEGLLEGDPLQNVKTPKIPDDQIVPFTQEQVQVLLDTARRDGRGRSPERDVALILLMVDAGLRASEVAALKIGDADRALGSLTIRVGKGGKSRMGHLGTGARRALWRYMESRRREAAPTDPLFVSEGGYTPGAAMTRSGIGEIVRNLGKAAGIAGVRCSPHTLRHTFAISYLRSGGNLLELQRLLGHEALEMTNRYVALTGVDLADAHRKASPVDRMGLR
jgi:site-specific recombinase XerD